MYILVRLWPRHAPTLVECIPFPRTRTPHLDRKGKTSYASVGRLKSLLVREFVDQPSGKRKTLSGKLVLFSWQGCPRWPGIIVPPRMKSLLVHCLGYKKVATLSHQRSSLWRAPTRDCLRTRAAAFEQGIKGLEFGKETWFGIMPLGPRRCASAAEPTQRSETNQTEMPGD